MATRYHVGAKELRSTLAAYAKRFDLLEVQMDKIGSASPAPATQATLRRWRKQVPPHFEFCVVASAALGRLKPIDVVTREIEDLKRVAFALEARVTLVRTPPDVTPASIWRERLARVFEKLPRDVSALAWEPQGLWEPDDAAKAAKKWDVALVVDAARESVPDGPVAYVRLRALGETRSFGPSALERVVESIGPRRDAYVVLETDGALSECKTLRRIVQGARETADARVLVKTRFRVRDDEQE